ncbi:MAG TPA: Hpt domain-containing protein [Bryobacteraceae bacterium]|nr:Hpt domain-containing protein [Bryobacteraceae bacterium]
MPRQSDVTVLDLDQLRDVCMEDHELMREVVTAVIEDAHAHIPEIRQAVESADRTRCARLAHYVKGACANAGARSMAAILKSIEHHADAGDFSACRDSLANLAVELERLSSEAAAI